MYALIMPVILKTMVIGFEGKCKMKNIGKLVHCDNCEKWVFLEKLEDMELDGGFTRAQKYTPMPEGWETCDVMGKSTDLCPDCSRMIRSILGYQMPEMAERIGLEVPHD